MLVYLAGPITGLTYQWQHVLTLATINVRISRRLIF